MIGRSWGPADFPVQLFRAGNPGHGPQGLPWVQHDLGFPMAPLGFYHRIGPNGGQPNAAVRINQN